MKPWRRGPLWPINTRQKLLESTPVFTGIRIIQTSKIFAATVALLVVATGCTQYTAPLAKRHMVAAANPHAAKAGLAVLRAGGGAVDATIAMQMVLTLVEPQSSGIGGGAFMIHYSPGKPEEGLDSNIQAYDGRETAPAATTDALFLSSLGRWPLPFRMRQVGGRGVGVPGTLRMLEMAHMRHGRLPWKRLFDHAILLAEKGFPVSPRLHAMIMSDKHLKNFPVARRYFYNHGRRPPTCWYNSQKPRAGGDLPAHRIWRRRCVLQRRHRRGYRQRGAKFRLAPGGDDDA